MVQGRLCHLRPDVRFTLVLPVIPVTLALASAIADWLDGCTDSATAVHRAWQA
jgi:hypothetical protein